MIEVQQFFAISSIVTMLFGSLVAFTFFSYTLAIGISIIRSDRLSKVEVQVCKLIMLPITLLLVTYFVLAANLLWQVIK